MKTAAELKQTVIAQIDSRREEILKLAGAVRLFHGNAYSHEGEKELRDSLCSDYSYIPKKQERKRRFRTDRLGTLLFVAGSVP